MRPLSTALPSRHGHGGTWRDDAARQGLVSDPGVIRLVAYYPQLAPLVGGPTAALLLCQLLFWTGRQRDPEGWIYKEQAEWSAETGLSRRAQEGARQKLRACGILEERYGDFPRRLSYRVNLSALGDAWRAAYHTLAPQSHAEPPRPPLSPVTTDPAATIAAGSEPPAQTTMLLDYPTPTRRTPPPELIPIVYESAIMDDAASLQGNAATGPAADPPDDATNLQCSALISLAHREVSVGGVARDGAPFGDTHNPIARMHETAMQNDENSQYKTDENLSTFARMHTRPRGENTAKRKIKKPFVRTRTSIIPPTSKLPDAAEKTVSAHAENPPAAAPPRGSARRPLKTPAPPTLPIPREVRAWVDTYAPGVDPDAEVGKFLGHCRAQRITNADWLEAFKNWCQIAYERAVKKGTLKAPPGANTAASPAEVKTSPGGRAGQQARTHEQTVDDRWREEYDRRYGSDPPRALHPASPPDVPSWQRPPPTEEDRIPIDELRTLVANFLAGHSLERPASAAVVPEQLEAQASSTAEPQSARGSLTKTLRAGWSTQRSGEVDWRARELLEEAIRARQAGQLPGESLGTIRQRLRAATTMAELDAVATQIPCRTSEAGVGTRGPPS
jgi:hypothetical protein